MSNSERTFNEKLCRRTNLIVFGINALERSILFPALLEQSLQPLPELVKQEYEQYKPLISEIYGEYHLKDDYLYHGTGRYHYQPEGQHKYESASNGEIVDLLKGIFTNGLKPQQDIWVPTPANRPTVSFTNHRFYSRWYADRHNTDQLLWSYGNSTDWAYLFTVKSISKLLEIPYIFLLMRTQSGKKTGLFGSAKSWMSDVRSGSDSETNFFNVLELGSTIPNNYSVIIITKKNEVPAYDLPLLRKSETRTLENIPSSKFAGIEVPLIRVEETKRMLIESGHRDIAVLPMECVDLHMSRFPLNELTKMQSEKKASKNQARKIEYAQEGFTPITLEQIKEASSDGNISSYSPYKLLDVMNQSDQLRRLLSQKSSWEGFNIHYHTLSGLLLFEKYFGHLDQLPGGVEKYFFRIFFSLHDIGDSLASTTKGKLIQNQSICVNFLSQMGFNEKEIKIASGLLSDDPLGSFLKKAGAFTKALCFLPQSTQTYLQSLSRSQVTNSLIDTGKKIQKMAKIAGMDYKDFFELLVIFHMIDAGSYTSEGGTIGSLDYAFTFDKERKIMTYSPLILSLVEQLKPYAINR